MTVRIHTWLRQFTLGHRFAVLVRWMMALAFLPSGAKKITGERFTQISTDVPIGSFFEAFFQASEFYAFVGLAQVLAGLLLIWPRTALLGALIYLPIISNIFVITWALQFPGTVFVTTALLLANLALLFWDCGRLAPLIDRNARYEPGRGSAAEAQRRLSARGAAGAMLACGAVGLGLAGLLWSGPGATVGALALVLGAMVLPACLACAWEVLAALAAARRRPCA